MLVVMYFYKSGKDRFPFNFILILTYLVQLLYIVTYIGVVNNSYDMAGRLYFGVLILLMGLYSVYNVMYIVRDKYRLKTNKLNNISKIVRGLYLVVSGILILAMFNSKMYMLDDRMIFGNNIINIIMWCYVVFNFIVLIGSKCIKLYVYNLLLVFMLIVDYIYPGIGFVNSFVVIITMYLYLVFENNLKKELDTVKLERDYYIKNTIDKYAFLKNISHEIRTPINTIDGLSQIVVDSKNELEMKEDLKDIRVASRELIDIINGMIDLSIIESGSLEIVNDNYNVYDMFDNIKNIVDSRLRDKSVKFSLKVDKGIPEVLLGDSERISQVILNLLGNSIKFTNKGSINLEVKCVKNEKLARLIITVSDTGIGIKSQELDSLFDRKDDKAIGLVLANHLVSLMNGKIEVDSVEGKGSTFIVSIDQRIIMEKDTNKDRDVKPFKVVGKRVLVVDDNKLNLKVISKMLVPYGVRIVEASSGNECLDILDKDTDFDLIFMDDMMPKLSGTETLNIIKKVSRIDGYYIPIVVLTANVTSGIREKYLGVGFDDYLAKPIDKSELSRVLKKYLKGRKKKNSEEE